MHGKHTTRTQALLGMGSIANHISLHALLLANSTRGCLCMEGLRIPGLLFLTIDLSVWLYRNHPVHSDCIWGCDWSHLSRGEVANLDVHQSTTNFFTWGWFLGLFLCVHDDKWEDYSCRVRSSKFSSPATITGSLKGLKLVLIDTVFHAWWEVHMPINFFFH